jgi:hypothetical protein
MWRKLTYMLLSERSPSEKATSCTILTQVILKKEKQYKDQWSQRREDEWVSTEDSEGREATLKDTAMPDSCHEHLSTSTKHPTPRMNPDANSDPGYVQTLILTDDPFGAGADGQGCWGGKQRVYRNSHSLVNFAVNLK